MELIYILSRKKRSRWYYFDNTQVTNRGQFFSAKRGYKCYDGINVKNYGEIW